LAAFWNREAAAAMKQLIRSSRPDVVHAHKLYPQLSAAPVVVASRAGLPVVQTLHDFELISASALDARGGWIDSDESALAYRALNSATLPVRRRLHVPRITTFVAASRFLARVAALHGIDATVIPHFVQRDREEAPGFGDRRGIVFVGRLRREKGVLDVVELARRVPTVSVKVVGEGTLDDVVHREAGALPNLEATGFVPSSEVGAILRSARVIVVPSRCHEAAGLVALEAMSHGTPTVVYPSGGLAEYVADARSGLVVPADVDSLARVSAELHDDEALWRRLSTNGLVAAADEYSPELYGERIERLYEQARLHSPSVAACQAGQ
jgi:glycosyltransferase involved in cell wall biosynthesis